MEREPTLYIGKQPFYIEYAGVNKKTGEKTEISGKARFVPEHWDNFAKELGYVRVGKEDESMA